MTTNLQPHTRGTRFRYRFGFGGGWTWSSFSEIKMTFRKSVPPSTETTDTAAVAQITKTGGGLTVDADPAYFWATIPDSVNASWPLGMLLWDIKGTRTSDGSKDEIDEGDVEIRPDMTRS